MDAVRRLRHKFAAGSLLSVFLICAVVGPRLSCAQTAPATPSAARQQFTAEVAQGSRALENGDNAAAERSFRQALALDPRSIELLNNLAISIARQGREDEAIALYERALRLREDDPVTKRNLAVAYFRAHRYKEALPLLKSFSAATPTFQSLDLTGLDLFALDRYAEAAQYLERASELQPGDLPTLDILGKAFWRAKNYAGVTKVFNRIMTINPGSPEAHFMLGLADDIEFHEQDAQKEFQAVLAADPGYPSVHSSLGLIDWRMNKAADAEKEFRLELSHHPDDPVSNYMMGLILRQQGNPQEAAHYLEAAVAVNPSYLDALFELGQCYLSLNRPQQAVEPLEKAIKLDPDSAQAHFVLARALALLGRNADAAQERNQAREIQARQHVQPKSAP